MNAVENEGEEGLAAATGMVEGGLEDAEVFGGLTEENKKEEEEGLSGLSWEGG